MKFRKKTVRETEWAALDKREERFLRKAAQEKQPVLNSRLERLVPDKLGATLDLAFYKAFELVFEKGTVLIEKTYRREDREMAYKVNAYAAGLKETRKNMKAFSKNSKNSSAVNILTSGASGIGLGVLGIGLPDIPLFTAMILKGIYEIAMSYGFPYDTPQEKCFILKIIRAALLTGDEAVRTNEELNRGMDEVTAGSAHVDSGLWKDELKQQTRLASAALSHELLYMKFLQGIPIAGAVGGFYDAVYMKKITDYADLKYKRRFLSSL